MNTPLRSRPIDFCLEENGDVVNRSNHRAEMAQLAKYDHAGATVYSVSALYEAYSSDGALYAFFLGR